MPGISGQALPNGNSLPAAAAPEWGFPERASRSERVSAVSRNLSRASNQADAPRSVLSSIRHAMGRLFGCTSASSDEDRRASMTRSASFAFERMGNVGGAAESVVPGPSPIGSASGSVLDVRATYDWAALDAWQQAGGPMERRPAAVRRIDAYFSQGTRALELGGLGLTSCPPVPDDVERLELADNPLQSLPTQWPSRLRFLSLASNALGDGTTQDARRLTRELMERGIVVSILGPSRPITLADAVMAWHLMEHQASATAWQAIADEAGGAHFGRFLLLLQASPNFKEPGFRQQVTDWLDELAARPSLRQKTFEHCEQATTNCQDHAALSFNDMQVLRLVADLEEDRHRLGPGLQLECMRGLHGMEKLREFAATLVAEIRQDNGAAATDIDEVQVFQRLYSALHDVVALPVVAQQMLYGSDVTQAHALRAAQWVLTDEGAFANYLSNSATWHCVLRRWDGAAVGAAEARFAAMVEDGSYQACVDADVDSILPGAREEMRRGIATPQARELYADAEREAGPVVLEVLRHEVFRPLTRAYLAANGLPALIERTHLD